MSSNSSDDNDIILDSFYKSDMKPYYDPYSKPAIELNELTKPSDLNQRNSNKLETDFNLGSGSISNIYKPQVSLM